VFDIDGVLVRGGGVLPQARAALAALYTPDGAAPTVPVAFLTNGGGRTEDARAAHLSELLGVRVLGSQVVQAHTPMAGLATRYADQLVLLSGRGDLPGVAASYGFRRVVTTQQLAAAFPSAVPFTLQPDPPLSASECAVRAGGLAEEGAPVAAVLVMTDPADWARDLQLIVDVVSSRGTLNRAVATAQGDTPVPVYIGHADLLWANDFPRPRFGLGAFGIALEALYERATGEKLPVEYYGKPLPAPFRMVEQLLSEQAALLGWEMPEGRASPFDAIFMVGDNPQVDVRGATAAAAAPAGHPWVCILVRTGVFQDTAPNCRIDPAQIVVDHVGDAVAAGAHHMRSLTWHSMR